MNNIKERFIVDEEEFSSRNSEKLIENIIDFVMVTKEGKILLSLSSMNNGDKIGLSAIARFLANSLEKTIPQEITVPEIMDATSLPREIISARLSELIKQRFIRRVKTGSYIAVPYRIEDFVKKIKSRYGTKK